MRQIAIIGSGPAGCYLAEQLLKLLPDSSIDVLERLPVPFGLIRYGVAPDHQATKSIARVLDRTLANPRVAFFGNVEVGRDIQFEELLSMYDAIVLATGAPCDRRLGIPGEDLAGVIGSGAFVGWYNAHPEALDPIIHNVREVVVIGNGNVAIDVTRLLAKHPTEFANSDLPPKVLQALASQPLKTISVVGRRGAQDAKFTPHELAELGSLRQARPVVLTVAELTGDSEVIRILQGFGQVSTSAAPISIEFHFGLVPQRFIGTGRLEAVQFADRSGTLRGLPAQLAVTCIGYEARACGSALPSHGVFTNEGGRIREGLYVTGWARRGPTGTIPTNRTEAQQLGQRMAREVADAHRSGRAVLREHLKRKAVSFVDHAGWKRIDAAELASAKNGQPRTKLASITEMLQAAKP
jgi:NADPH-dependent glutamate synthase beta subunit-like oxidoreductase